MLANATVYLACRDHKKCQEAAKDIKEGAVLQPNSKGAVQTVDLDLADLKHVDSVATKLLTMLPRLDILVNNAGVATQFPHTLTKDGVEITFQVN